MKTAFRLPRPGALLRAMALSLVVAGGLTALTPAPTRAHSYRMGDIMIGHVWAAPTPKNADGVAVYGPLLNSGKTQVQLEGASSPIAAKVQFRIDKDGKTRWVEKIALAPGRPLALASWRVHIWLSGLKHPLHGGDSFPLTLDFGPAGKLTVTVEVERSPGH